MVIRMAAIAKIHSLCMDRGIRNGNADSIELTAAPPAMVATTAGSTQHSKVPDEVNNVKTLKALSFIWMPFRIHSFLKHYRWDSRRTAELHIPHPEWRSMLCQYSALYLSLGQLLQIDV